MQGKLIVISGLSGVGKTIIGEKLRQKNNLVKFLTYTTRPPRKDERDGVHYHFVTREQFMQLVNQRTFIEYTQNFGNYYGTPKSILQELNNNCTGILEVDYNAVIPLRQNVVKGAYIFLLPPDMEALLKRLNQRGTETPEQISARLKRVSEELSNLHLYDMSIVNTDIDKTVEQIERYLKIRGIL